MLVVAVNVKANVTKTLRVVAASEQEALEKARRMFLNEIEVCPDDIDCEIRSVEGEAEDAPQGMSVPKFLKRP